MEFREPAVPEALILEKGRKSKTVVVAVMMNQDRCCAGRLLRGRHRGQSVPAASPPPLNDARDRGGYPWGRGARRRARPLSDHNLWSLLYRLSPGPRRFSAPPLPLAGGSAPSGRTVQAPQGQPGDACTARSPLRTQAPASARVSRRCSPTAAAAMPLRSVLRVTQSLDRELAPRIRNVARK